MGRKPIKDANDLANAAGLDAVGAAVDGAQVVRLPSRKRKAAEPEPPAASAWGHGAEQPPLPMLPEGCPIVPLGVRKQTYYFLDALGQLIDLAADKVAQKGILAMFGDQTHLVREYWPRWSKPDAKGNSHVNGWAVDQATELLMGVAAREGVFDVRNRVRGRGAHKGPDGELILHCGDKLWHGPVPGAEGDGQWSAPGLVGRMVYPTGAKLPRPAVDPATTETADWLLGDILSTWQWKRAVDPVLLLGWIVCAMIGGALDWRPVAWVSGDSATGKTTLQELIELLFNGELLKLDDGTEAFIRQELGHDTLPVALDEAEAEEDNRKINNLVKLARLAAGGGFGGRGGADGKSQGFTLKSCFLFSSILLPAMQPQDKNRMAVLELMKLPPGSKPPIIEAATMRNAGAALRRRIRDQWPRLPGTLNHFRALLSERGHIGRGANVFGTLLACAHLVLYDDIDAPIDMDARDAAAGWADQLAANRLSELAEEMSNADRCGQYLASKPLAGVSGAAPMSVGWWCLKAISVDASGDPKARLGAVGMRVVQVTEKGIDDDGGVKLSITDPPGCYVPGGAVAPALAAQLYLAVASAHEGLTPLFAGSSWQGRAGAAGGWGQALRRIDGAVAGEKVRIDGKTSACTLVPLAKLIDLGREGAEA
jgi:hypothetical protein